jgi:hypothetical protein
MRIGTVRRIFAFLRAMVVDISVYIAVLLAFGLVFASNHHIARAATQKPTERLWVVVLGRAFVFAAIDNFLDIIKQLFRDNRRIKFLWSILNESVIVKLPNIKQFKGSLPVYCPQEC